MKKIIGTFLFLLTVLLTASCGEIHTHQFGADWNTSETEHWHQAICEHTNEISDKAEHTWDAGVVTISPTEETVGEKKYTCTVCKYSKTEEISKLTHEHSWDDADCDTPKTCSKCGETEGAALGHDYTENYTWSEDLSKVTATLVCGNDSSHNITEEVSTSYEVINASTTTVKGLGRYTATFENVKFNTQVKDIELDLIATKTYYFVPGVWAENDATFGIKVWNGEKEEIFKPVTLGESGYYEFSCSIDMTHILLVRYDSTGEVWWNGSPELEIPANKNMFVITSWDSYLWDEFLTVDNAAEFVEGDTLYLQLNGDWSSAASGSGFAAQFEGLNGSSDILALELVDSTNSIYKITVPTSGYIRVRFAQVNPSNVYEIWNVSDYTHCDHDTNTNLIVLQNGWNSMKGNWSNYSE